MENIIILKRKSKGDQLARHVGQDRSIIINYKEILCKISHGILVNLTFMSQIGEDEPKYKAVLGRKVTHNYYLLLQIFHEMDPQKIFGSL